MSGLPGGVVTFLFSDVEGSTALWEQDAEAMRTALAEHDEMAQGVIDAAGGTIFKHTGDGFAAVFSGPSDALSAAVDFNNRLAQLPGMSLNARMGVHTGEASPRDGDYFGRDVNRAARTMDAANGGQIVVSDATYAIAQRDIPDGISLVDVGSHRLKDLGEPVHLYQAIAEGTSDRRPLRTLEAAPNNLPVQLSSFIGREGEVAELVEIVRGSRLTTLTGIGGVGKTRLSLQVGAELLHEFADGVWFVELAGLSEPGLIPLTTIGALRLKTDQARPAIEQLIDEIGGKELLLVVDNCEHLIDDVAKFVDVILRSAPNVRLIATSREGLAVDGERLWRVPSLGVDHDESALDLFEQRAQLVTPDFVIDETNRDSVVAICERLDGIPLAIELATGRLKMLDVQQIAEHLNDRFRLLTGGSRVAVERQRTLLAMMDWSYDLLTDHEKALVRRLAVFVGGFDFAAAEAVAAGEQLPRFEILDLLGRLVETSLVTFEQDPVPRYRLLETVRQYGLDRLAEAGEADEARLRHAQHYSEIADVIAEDLNSERIKAASATARRELPNMRAAMTWAYESGDIDHGLRIAVGIRPYFFNIGALDEALSWTLRGVKSVERFEGTIPIRALAYATTDALNAGDDADLDWLRQKTEEVANHVDDLEVKGDLVNALGNLALFTRPREADPLYVEAIEIYKQAGSDRWVSPLNNRFNVVWITASTETARELISMAREAEAAGLQGDDPVMWEAVVEMLEGRPESALEVLADVDLDDPDMRTRTQVYSMRLGALVSLQRFVEAVAVREEIEFLAEESSSARVFNGWSLANLYLTVGDPDEAEKVVQPLVSVSKSKAALGWRARLVIIHASVAAARGNIEDAAQLIGFWETCSSDLGMGMHAIEEQHYAETVKLVQEKLGDDEYKRLVSKGARLDVSELPAPD